MAKGNFPIPAIPPTNAINKNIANIQNEKPRTVQDVARELKGEKLSERAKIDLGIGPSTTPKGEGPSNLGVPLRIYYDAAAFKPPTLKKSPPKKSPPKKRSA